MIDSFVVTPEIQPLSLTLKEIREPKMVVLCQETNAFRLWSSSQDSQGIECVGLHIGDEFEVGCYYRDEVDLTYCDLDYFHPPRMLWASDRSACFLVCPDIQVTPINIIQH